MFGWPLETVYQCYRTCLTLLPRDRATAAGKNTKFATKGEFAQATCFRGNRTSSSVQKKPVTKRISDNQSSFSGCGQKTPATIAQVCNETAKVPDSCPGQDSKAQLVSQSIHTYSLRNRLRRRLLTIQQSVATLYCLFR